MAKFHLKFNAPRFLRGAFFLSAAFILKACHQEQAGTTSDANPPPPPSLNPPDWWDAEKFEVSAQSQLREVVLALSSGDHEDLADLVDDVSKAIHGELRPPISDARVSKLGNHTVHYWDTSGTAPQPLVNAWESLTASWPANSEPRLKVKNFDVQLSENHQEAYTRTDFHAYVAGSGFSVQQTGKWLCRWQLAKDPADSPRLLHASLIKLEEVIFNHGGQGSSLHDMTSRILGSLPAWHDSLKLGANHWIPRLPRLKHRFQNGIAIGDLDQNGLEDVYLCQPEGLPNLLLLRQPDGSVTEAAAEFGINFRDNSTSALFADLDNDGDQDLAIAFRSPFDIFENVDGKFHHRFNLPGAGQIFNIVAADPNADGLLDLFVCRYQNLDDQGRAPSAIPLHDAQNGGRNTLFKNLGAWKFADITSEVGLDQNNNRWTMAAAWEDYDRDGDLDLYLANDYGRNNLYRCDTKPDGTMHFTDIAPETGTEDMTTSMGVTWADPNRDGRPDVYVSNMYSSAGRRVTTQKGFKKNIPGSDQSHVAAWQHAAMGNSLFQSQPDGSFLHASQAARVHKGLWSWGTVFADFNHDGWDDLLVANGFITGPGKAPDL
jgi:hypothetical protein